MSAIDDADINLEEKGGLRSLWDTVVELFGTQKHSVWSGIASIVIPLVLGLVAGTVYGFPAETWLLPVVAFLAIAGVLGGSGLVMLMSASTLFLMMLLITDERSGSLLFMLATGLVLVLMLFLHDMARSLRRAPSVAPEVADGYTRTIAGIVAASTVLGATTALAATRTWGGIMIPLALLALGLVVVAGGIAMRRRLTPQADALPPVTRIAPPLRPGPPSQYQPRPPDAVRLAERQRSIDEMKASASRYPW